MTILKKFLAGIVIFIVWVFSLFGVLDELGEKLKNLENKE